MANRLGLPFHRALDKTEDRPEQKTMANSTQQARNVDGSLVVAVESLPGGPVLLVDDMVEFALDPDGRHVASSHPWRR